MNVLIATQKPFAPEAVKGITDILEAAGHQVTLLEKYAGEDELKAAACNANAMIVRSDTVSAGVIESAPQLRIVVRAGAGYDNVNLQAASRAGVVVMNTPGQNANAVAELALGLMIFMARTQFTPATGTEIQGKTLGIQAFGNVGSLVAKKASAMGMKVQAVDPFLPATAIEATGTKALESLEELYSTSDYLSIHIPATPQTVRSIGYDLITRMPKGATLVNTARKEVMDEDGLFRALQDRPDLKYVADVAPDNLAAMQEAFGLRVFATPKKMGAQTDQANINAGLAAARQIVDYFLTGNTKYQVNK